MKMSWFFGKKKRDSPPSSPEEEDPPAGNGDGFIFVERRSNQPQGPATNEGWDPPPGNLYPSINNIPQYPPPQNTSLPKQNIDPIQNMLNDLPFKLCKQLEHNVSDDIEVDMNHVDEILSWILRLENENVTYDFAVENSVISEMDSSRTGM
ncbi:uncharacterized protein LOC105693783 isoform X1 [Athalia rosae]|uniref:uncharacterized protein LOC105693783 isoform X1 n=2 Tax=Athalia rosae TaxID=37344 RepID=UPI000626AB4C|nr:uncharacterized protein LOC105693783 isoform X1 [Athalia rosae]